jgi:hypothetical protein
MQHLRCERVVFVVLHNHRKVHTMDKRKLPVEFRNIELKDKWEGWSFVARMNPPVKTFGLVASGDFDKIIEGLSYIIISWNFVDENGDDMLAPSIGSINNLPIDLINVIANRFVEEMTILPPA